MIALRKYWPVAPVAIMIAIVGVMGQQVAGWSIASDSEPRLVLSQSDIDLGEVQVGSAPAGFIRVRNGGGQRLIINPEAGQCPYCEQESTLIVPAGGQGFLPYRLNIQSHAGLLSEEIRFQTNDRSSPTFVVKIRGQVCDPSSRKGDA